MIEYSDAAKLMFTFGVLCTFAGYIVGLFVANRRRHDQ